MFNGLFNNGSCGEPQGGCFGGCNCTWIILIVLFLCCGGKMGNWCLTINPTCLLLMIALLFCCGGLSLGSSCH